MPQDTPVTAPVTAPTPQAPPRPRTPLPASVLAAVGLALSVAAGIVVDGPTQWGLLPIGLYALLALLGMDIMVATVVAIASALLILMPDRSPFVTARMGVELLERVPQAELAMVPGAKHGLPFSHGAECGTRLAAHLAKAEAG